MMMSQPDRLERWVRQIGRALLVSVSLGTHLGVAQAQTQSSAPQLPSVAQAVEPPDGTWTADAELIPEIVATDTTLGAGQGIVVRDGRVYAFGDKFDARPRVGVIREYTLDLVPTGRTVWLQQQGRPVIRHPTGLTWSAEFGTFLGDTVDRRAVIYQIDWDRAWQDGNLDQAIRRVCRDDAAINGCRPEFVQVDGQTLLATADYGNVRPEIRLIDPARLVAEQRTSAPGVIRHRIAASPWNQSLHWVAERGELVCVANVIEGRGWRLETINLARAVGDGRADGPGVRLGRVTLAGHDELEGYWRLDAERSLWISSNRVRNLQVARLRAMPPRPTLPKSDARAEADQQAP